MSCDSAPQSVNQNSGTMQFYDSGYGEFSQPVFESQQIHSPGANSNTIITLPPPANFNPPIQQAPFVPSTVIPDRSPEAAPPEPTDTSLEPATGGQTRQSMPFTKDNEFIVPKNEVVESSEPKKFEFDDLPSSEPETDFEPIKLKAKSDDLVDVPLKFTPPAKTEMPKRLDMPGRVEPDPNQLAATGVSGGAAIKSDARFETFKLSDLFSETTVNETMEKQSDPDQVIWGPPVVVGNDTELFDAKQAEEEPAGEERSAAERAERGEELVPTDSEFENEPLLNQEPILETVQQKRKLRSQAEIVRSLQNSKVPNRIIYDNTPSIPQQEISNSPLVLNARPIEYYHEIRHIAETKRQKLRAVARERIVPQQTAETVHSGIPVLQASTSLVRRPEDFDFRPLPELSALQQQVIKVGASGPAVEESFAPESFPQAAAPTALAEDPEFANKPLPEPEIPTSLLPPLNQPDSGVKAKPVSSQQPLSSVLISHPTDDQQSEVISRRPALILKAAPQRDSWLESTYDNGKAAKAKFRFVQPKYQRVIEQE